MRVRFSVTSQFLFNIPLFSLSFESNIFLAFAMKIICNYYCHNAICIVVTRMLVFAIEGVQNNPMRRIARIRDFSVKTLVTGHTLDEVDISNPSLSATGANNIVSYQPNYQDTTNLGHGGTNTTAVFFINMKEVFPCIKSLILYRYEPVCKIFTNEEDGFRSFRSIIEAADSGNYFRIFNTTSDIPTYGFGIQGCAEFTMECLPTHHKFVIVCYSPC